MCILYLSRGGNSALMLSLGISYILMCVRRDVCRQGETNVSSPWNVSGGSEGESGHKLPFMGYFLFSRDSVKVF